ncbi:OLC1v1000709C1 [Oldenlandia corymbosa var. corymbosa]|uniref:OLC1v1000709C1 n=1 Tax=Oldenlandia corymbosa var. corymbosa TaxID=529605 RepID=A0AAV1D4J1_OLDCO|nr:OLC1v1000709C1 [Oldenlandia corymbosa var. corymbosa]
MAGDDRGVEAAMRVGDRGVEVDSAGGDRVVETATAFSDRGKAPIPPEWRNGDWIDNMLSSDRVMSYVVDDSVSMNADCNGRKSIEQPYCASKSTQGHSSIVDQLESEHINQLGDDVMLDDALCMEVTSALKDNSGNELGVDNVMLEEDALHKEISSVTKNNDLAVFTLVGKMARSEKEAYDLYNDHARLIGFCVRVGKQKFRAVRGEDLRCSQGNIDSYLPGDPFLESIRREYTVEAFREVQQLHKDGMLCRQEQTEQELHCIGLHYQSMQFPYPKELLNILQLRSFCLVNDSHQSVPSLNVNSSGLSFANPSIAAQHFSWAGVSTSMNASDQSMPFINQNSGGFSFPIPKGGSQEFQGESTSAAVNPSHQNTSATTYG